MGQETNMNDQMTTSKYTKWTEEVATHWAGPCPFVEVRDAVTSYCTPLDGRTPTEVIEAYKETANYTSDDGAWVACTARVFASPAAAKTDDDDDVLRFNVQSSTSSRR